MKFKVNFMESIRSIKQPLGLFMSDNKRNLFEEIIDGLRQIRRSRESKEIIETLSEDPLDVSSIDGEQLTTIRQKLNVSAAVFAKLKSVIPFWHYIEDLFLYILTVVDFKPCGMSKDVQSTIEDDKITPEIIWDNFLNELDTLFNEKGIVLSYALSSACAKIAVHYDVYVLEDEDYKEFSYYSVIIERVKNDIWNYWIGILI